MKVIKLFITSILLLSSFQTFAAFSITTAANVSTPENTDKVIKLTVNKNGFNELIFGRRKFTMSGKDVNKFTISDEDLKSKLTFKATAFEAGSDNTYSVNIKAEFRFMTGPSSVAYTQTTEKTITVTVTKDPDNGEHVPTFHITTVDVSTPENTDKTIELTLNKGNTPDYKRTFAILDGADANKFTLAGNKLTFIATAFEARSDVTYHVNIKATLNAKILPDIIETTEKTITVTVDEAFRITTANVSIPEHTNRTITLATNKDGASFTIVGNKGKFSLSGTALTFEGADFKDHGDNNYHVKIKATKGNETAEKTLTVTIDNPNTGGNPDDDGGFHITTADVSTPEQINKVITLATNKGGASFTIVGGADKNRFSLNGDELTFKATFFNSRRNNPAYRVKIKATRMDSNSRLLETEKILVVTVLEGLYIITTDVSAPENKNKVITLAVNKKIPAVTSITLDFEIVRGLDANKFTLVGNKLTFEAPAFNDRTDATYRVKIKATFAETFGFKPKTETAEKILTVTIINPNTNDDSSDDEETTSEEGGADSVVEEFTNVKVIAQAVRKENKFASKALLSKVGKTLMGRLSYIRHQNQQKSSFSTNGFVNGIQVSFADSQTNSFINRVLSANGLSNVIPTSSRKVERWDTWTSAQVVIGRNNGAGTNKTEFNLRSLNIGMDRRIAQDKTIGFALGLGKQDRTATGIDFSGDVDTKQYTLSSYGALELSSKGSIEAVLGVAKATHKVGKSNTPSADQGSNGFFASIAYRADLQAQSVDLSPFIRYDINRIKMKANDILTSSETNTDEAIALGIDISKTANYKEGQLTRFVSLEYKSDLRRDGNDYLSKNAEQEVSVKLGLDYQQDDIITSVSYERIQSTNNKAHSNGIEGTVRWKF